MPHAIQVYVKRPNFKLLELGFQTWDLSFVDHYKCFKCFFFQYEFDILMISLSHATSYGCNQGGIHHNRAYSWLYYYGSFLSTGFTMIAIVASVSSPALHEPKESSFLKQRRYIVSPTSPRARLGAACSSQSLSEFYITRHVRLAPRYGDFCSPWYGAARHTLWAWSHASWSSI